MHQQPPSQQYNIPQGGGQHYQAQQNPMGMMGQGNHVMGQRPMPPYRPPQQGMILTFNLILFMNCCFHLAVL
uniref:Uncharacterized protein n=1 Tax=Erpetoichthys calabaricus TaxID=27687 RepID=A0A8C4RUJ8_ERPCA